MKFRNDQCVITPCPWHDEATPSCCINLERERVYCFGCGRLATLQEYSDAIDRAGLRSAVTDAIKAWAEPLLA